MSQPPDEHSADELEKMTKRQLIKLVLKTEEECYCLWERAMGDDL